jgi:hypothetical protein
MAKKKKDLPEPVELENEDEELLEKALNPKKEEKRTNSIPKQSVNFDDQWIKENIKDHSIAQLLQAKREADMNGDVTGARKVRRALRSRGIYVSKMRDDLA